MYVLDCIFDSSFVVCRIQSLLSLLILTALKRTRTMFHWKTVGMLVHSFYLPATCVHRVADPPKMPPTDLALMTSITTWSSWQATPGWSVS